MSRVTAVTALAFAVLVPACLDATVETDGATEEAQQGLVRAGYANKLTSLGDRVVAYALTTKLQARLVDASGAPIQGAKVNANIDGVIFSATTDADGIATIKSDFTQLGAPKQHVVAWSEVPTTFGASVATASSLLTVIRSDCQVAWSSSKLVSGKHQMSAFVTRRASDGQLLAPLTGKPIEFMNNNVVVGTATTSTTAGTLGYATLTTTPLAPSGNVTASFNGDAYFAPCALTAPYVFAKPAVQIRLSVTDYDYNASMNQAMIGSSTLDIHVEAGELFGSPRANLPVTIWAAWDPTTTRPYPVVTRIGTVTTGSGGTATLRHYPNALSTGPYFTSGHAVLFVTTDAPVDYEAYSPKIPLEVYKGFAKIMLTNLGLYGSGDTVLEERTWRIRTGPNDLPTPGFLLSAGPCGLQVADADGRVRCKYDPNLPDTAAAFDTEAWTFANLQDPYDR